jgi:hypothetical protein
MGYTDNGISACSPNGTWVCSPVDEADEIVARDQDDLLRPDEGERRRRRWMGVPFIRLVYDEIDWAVQIKE